MRRLPNLPNLLVDEGARRLALGHLADAVTARARLTDPADPEALHDYRVALRRLRSCLRAYRKPLRTTITGETRRQLRRLAHGTNRSRDLEVHLEWLARQSERVAAEAKPGVAWMVGRLTAERHRVHEVMLDLDQRLFPKLHARLSRELVRFRTTIDLSSSSRRRTTAAATARRARSDAARLQDRLRGIEDYSSTVAIHRARIAAKHLRYLLEPFIGLVSDGAAAVERLKALQDTFGDAHDAHLFAAELQKAAPDAAGGASASGFIPGLEALVTSLEARGSEAFERAAGDWLGGTAEPFFRQVDTLADAIADLAARDQEVERKFLLTGLPSLERAGPPVEIEQGYLPGERLIERVRRVTSAEGVELVRTVKEGSGLTRIEIEEPVTPDVFARLWPLTEGRRIRKRRYRIPEGSLTWEIDRFLDRDLVLAEVELPSESQADVEMPAWLTPHVQREVTEEEAYSNFRLAVEREPSPTRGNGDRPTPQGVTNSDREPPPRPAGRSQLREATQPSGDDGVMSRGP